MFTENDIKPKKRRRLPVIIILGMVLIVSFGAYHLFRPFETAFFGDIRGLSIRPAEHSYDDLIRRMGQPHARGATTRTLARWDGTEIISNLQVLYYEGLTFFVNEHDRVSFIDITSERYTLGGRNRIGVGSTRAEVNADYRQRRANPFPDCACSRFSGRAGYHSLENAEFRYYQYFTRVEFEFGEDNRVARMRISRYD